MPEEPVELVVDQRPCSGKSSPNLSPRVYVYGLKPSVNVVSEIIDAVFGMDRVFTGVDLILEVGYWRARDCDKGVERRT